MALLSPAFGQKATVEQMGAFGPNPGYGTLHLKTNLGSFRVMPGDPLGKAEGRFELVFKGAVLVSQLDGTIDVGPGVVKEFDAKDRQVYHGSGRIVVSGKWRALQWFGDGLDAVWYGKGIIRLTGEFDKALSTGEYWFNDPENKGAWTTTGMELTVPERQIGVAEGVVPTKKGGGGN